ncbi:MAG: filamentous hemagglutinin N-terminal domain-containing protein [Geobacteraceae bacterium]|nr:filamentous hemagglutinin N-terminal domain-containing protein [Geobacteraceae bacterium]
MKRHHKFITAGTAVCTITLLSVLTAITSHALPQNGAVVGGSAAISQPNPTTMNINQTSGNAIINWQGYSIGANEAVKYIQPGSNSIALNRVTGVDPSQIYGLLSGNGQVWVINPNGLLVGPGATVQTGSFLASTMNITNEDFLSGKHQFANTPGSQASIVNQGNISAANGGYVVLAAPSVANSGSIVADLGTVHLASGDAVTLSLDNGSLINVAVNGDVAANALGVSNRGHISADGGKVILTARVAGDIMKNIVNNDGIIMAKSINDKNGVITLDGGDYGITANRGTLDASGKKTGETGGTIKILGDRVGLFAGSTINASGDAGGGTVLIGGNFHGAGAEKNASMTYVDKDASIKADALTNGNGGQVAVWADEATRFYGTISAQGGTLGGDGGFAEVSGKHNLTYGGLVNLGAAKGATGTLLLDPDDITIIHAVDAGSDTADNIAATEPFINWDSTAAPSNISDFTINAQLATPANVTVQTSTGSIASNSDADITLNGNTLTLQSAADISLDGTYRGTGGLDLNFAGTLDLSAAPTFVGGPTVSATGMGAASVINAAGGTWSLSGVNQGSVAGLNFNSIGKIVDNGTGTLSTAGTQVYNLTGSNMGNVTTLLPGGFEGIGNLSSTGAATFNMGSVGSVTGNLNGGTAGSINYGSYTSPVTLDLAGNATTGIGGSWSNIATVTGSNVNSDTVKGLTKTYTLDGSIADKGSSSGVTWSSFENITDTGAGIFNFGAAGSVAGNISAVGGTLDYSGHTTAVNVNLAGSPGSSTGIGGTWSGITSVTGSANSGDTVTGATQTYTLDNTLANKGSNGTVTWTAMENLTDTGSGTFNMGSGGRVTGSINGGVGGNINYSSYTNPVTFNLGGTAGTTGIGGSWSNIGTVTGNANSSTIVGSSKTYTLDNSIANRGSNGGVTWSGFKNITDTGTGIFNMGSGGSVTGNLDGGLNGTLNYSNYTNPVTLNLAGSGTSGIGTTWSHISTVIGSNNNDTVSGSGKTYNLTGTNAGNSGVISWTSFENIADSGAGTISTTGGQTYNLTGSNAGYVTTLLPGSFTGISNLNDSGAGVFRFDAGGAVTGSLSAVNGTLDYSAGIAGPVAVDLSAKSGSGIGGNWNGIATLVGSGASDTISGSNANYNLTAANAGNSGGVSWTSFEKIANSGTGTIAATGGQTYNLTGANSGNVAILLPGDYTGIGNLSDSGAGNFRFGAGGTVTGGITATGGTLDYSAGSAGPVAINLASKSGSGIGGTWNGITTLVGSGASDTIVGSNATYNLTAADSGNSGGVDWSSFENLHDTAAGIFRFTPGGAVSGGLNAVGGTLDYSAGIAGPVAVDLSAKSGSGIGGNWNGIATLVGSGASDTISGSNANYNLTAANAGNSSGVSWTSFEKITDSGTGTIAATGGQTYNLTGANTGDVTTLLPGGYTGIGNLSDSGAGNFRFGAGGTVTAGLNAVGGTLDYSAGIAGPVAVDLSAKSGSGIGGTWNGITTVLGSGASDTIVGSNATYNLTASDSGNSGGVGWNSFENLNDTAAGIFRFTPGGAVSDDLTAVGGTLDYSAGIAGPVAVDLSAKSGSGIGGTWNGITTVTGSAHSSDTISGNNQTYNLTGADAGNNGGVSWTSFENIAGTGTNSYSGSTGSLLSGAISDTGSAATVQGEITTGGAQAYSGPITLGGTTTMTSTGSGAITFGSTVASDSIPRDLTVGTSGVTTFSGVVGTTPLNSLTVKPGGTTYINGGLVATTGTAGQEYNNAVILGGDTILNAGSGAITEGSEGSLTAAGLLTTLSGSGQNLVGNGTNTIADLNATNSTSGDIILTTGSPLLTITGINQAGGGLILTNNGAITGSGPLAVSGATSISASGQPVTLANADNDFGGALTVAGATTRITDKNDLAVILNTTGPTTLTAGAGLNISGISTDSVSATAVDKVTLSNPAASILHITGATIAGTMNNSSPLDLTTTSELAPVTVNLKGNPPFLTLVGDVKTQIGSLGLYNGAAVMGREMDHYNELIDLRTATNALAVNAERFGTMGMMAFFNDYFNIAPMVSGIDYSHAFNTPETEPKLIDF